MPAGGKIKTNAFLTVKKVYRQTAIKMAAIFAKTNEQCKLQCFEPIYQNYTFKTEERAPDAVVT